MGVVGSPFAPSTMLLLPVGMALLVTQYTGLFYIATQPHSDFEMCQPRIHAGAWHGWQSGLCYTEEQLWCRAHNNRHIDCGTADCRAEEIRLTLYALYTSSETADGPKNVLPSRTPVYDTAGTCFYQVYDHINNINYQPPEVRVLGTCVPPGDRRANFLPICPTATARCRSLYYRPFDYDAEPSFECSYSVGYLRQQSYHNQWDGSVDGNWNWENFHGAELTTQLNSTS